MFRMLVLALACTSIAGFVDASTPHQTVSASGIKPVRAQQTLFVVGDSLTLGTQSTHLLNGDNLERALKKVRLNDLSPDEVWSKVTVIAEISKRVSWGESRLREQLRYDSSTTAVIVALGTNDVAHAPTDWAARIRSLLDTSGDIPVMWLTIEFAATVRADWRANAVAFNRALYAVGREVPYRNRLRVVRWATFFPNQCAFLVGYASDGIHLSQGGYRCRIFFIADRARTFARVAIANL